MDKIPEPQNKKYRSGIRYKLFLAASVFLLFAIIAVAQHIFTDPPVGICDANGCRFGNTSQDANNYTSDSFKVMNWFGTVVGTYLDSYSCDATYCIYQPRYAPGQIYVKNMSTGMIDFSGTDSTTVMQSAFNTIQGKTFFLKSGTYTMNGHIDRKNNSLIGESVNTTILKLNNGVIDSIISELTSYDTTLSDITFDGQGTTQAGSRYAGIQITYPQNVLINRIKVINTAANGILFGDSAANTPFTFSNLSSSKKSKIINSYISDTGQQDSGNGKGITIFQNDDVEVMNNEIHNNPAAQCIQIVGSYYNNVVGNYCDSTFDGIFTTYGSFYNNIDGNTLINLSGTGIYSLTTGIERDTGIQDVLENIHHNTIINVSKAISIDSGGGESIHDNLIKDSPIGIQLAGATSGYNITNISIFHNQIINTTTPIYLSYTSNTNVSMSAIDIDSNEIYTPSGNAIWVSMSGAQNKLSDITIRQNKIINPLIGIKFDAKNLINSPNRISIEGNLIKKSTSHGMFFDFSNSNSSDISINNNKIYNSGSPGSGSRGIFVNGDSTTNISIMDVYDNFVEGSDSHQIDLRRNITHLIVERNIVNNTNTSAGGFAFVFTGVAASNNQTIDSFANNKIYNSGANLLSQAFGTINIKDNVGLSPFWFGNQVKAPTAYGAGDTYYNTTSNVFCGRNNTAWVNVYTNSSGDGKC